MCTLFRAAIITAVALLVTAAPAQRIATIGKKVPLDVRLQVKDREGEREFYLLRELRGGISLFYFWRSTNLRSTELLSEMEELHRKFGRQGVRFISATADKEEKIENIMTEKNFEFFRYNFRELPGLHYHLGAFSEPYVVLIDPRGILIWRGVPDKHLEERIADLIARTNPPVADQTWKEQRLRRVEILYNRGEYGRAYTIARNLFQITDQSDNLHGRAESWMARCETGARQKLTEALQAEQDKEFEKAARIVAQIAVRFHDPDEEEDDDRGRGTRDEQNESVNRTAEREIGRMNGDRKLKKAIREARDNAEGELQNDLAADLEEDGYYIEAKQIYEKVIEDYEKAEAAKEAKLRLRRITRDKDIQKKIAERWARNQAFGWLDIGDHFAAMESYGEAREFYERIVSEHPDTLAATRAEQRLGELPKPRAAGDTETAGTGSKP